MSEKQRELLNPWLSREQEDLLDEYYDLMMRKVDGQPHDEKRRLALWKAMEDSTRALLLP